MAQAYVKLTKNLLYFQTEKSQIFKRMFGNSGKVSLSVPVKRFSHD